MKTKWIELPDVTTTRRDVLKVPPVRKHLDSINYYTIPVIYDTATEIQVGDSFDIVVYLEKTYPDLACPLIPPQFEAIMRAWNEKCNAVFSGTTNTFGPIGMLYVHRLPFNPKTAEVSKSRCVATVLGMSSWDDLISGMRQE
jgi:glutathione S-transferase